MAMNVIIISIVLRLIYRLTKTAANQSSRPAGNSSKMFYLCTCDEVVRASRLNTGVAFCS